MNPISKFDTRKSLGRAKAHPNKKKKWSLSVRNHEYSWENGMDRITLIRQNLPYESIEAISNKSDVSVKRLLQLMGMPQTTYNKKLRENSLLSNRESELILMLAELIEFGEQVFNDEQDKFRRWLKKPNISLGGKSPESLFDSLTGILEVKNCLNRIEYGNLA
jgi:putative toxin-antitoxin system antitoxin component (TIGR02293 family)